jgi:hypothetical protein
LLHRYLIRHAAVPAVIPPPLLVVEVLRGLLQIILPITMPITIKTRKHNQVFVRSGEKDVLGHLGIVAATNTEIKSRIAYKILSIIVEVLSDD